MKSLFKAALVVLCVLAVVGSVAKAQDLQEQLSKLGSQAAVGFTSPLLTGFGNDLNSAWFYSADLHDILGFDVGVKVALSTVKDADKTYQLTLPSTSFGTFSVAQGDYDQVITANSAVGKKDITSIKTKNGRLVPAGTEIGQLPGGFDLPAVPLIMPQLDLGLPFGLEVMARYVPTISAGDAGKFNYMGFGVRYDIDQWIPFMPIDIAVHFTTQKMNFKSKSDQDIFSAKATAYGLEVSKKLFILTLYGGFQIESSTMTLNDFQGINQATGTAVTISGYDVNGSDKSRFTLGARLLLLIINVHAEYSFATVPVAAVGVGISIR